jgi:hypothetical protein
MWRELTEDDVLAALNAPEAAAYQSAAIADGQDVLEDITGQVVQECRAHIADCPRNALAAGATLPERVMYHAVALIRFRMLTRLDLEVSKDRMAAKQDAIRFFERVADGRVTVEQPEGETDDSSGAAGVETISSRGRQATRENLRGL